MNIIPITVGDLGTNCYVLYDDKKKGIIIDPGANPELILNVIYDKDLKIEKIILTHGHFDHIGAIDLIKEKIGADIAIHEYDEEMLKDSNKNLSRIMGFDYSFKEGADILLQEGDKIQFGDSILYVLHTPGHSKGGICLLDENNAIFTGDTLFMRSIGRTDFYGGDYETLINSINNKIMSFEDHLIVYPGHGPITTIGDERRMNPYVGR